MTKTLNTIPDEAAPLMGLIKPKKSILTATNETAIALANKGMDVRFVYGLGACHTDSKVQLEQRVPALIWAMAPWKEKLAAKKSA